MLRRLFRKGHADAIGKRTPLKRNFQVMLEDLKKY